MSTFAWLIEAGQDADGAYWWWNEGWVRDAWEASRFDTRDAAETAMRERNLSARVVEHGFASDPCSCGEREACSDPGCRGPYYDEIVRVREATPSDGELRKHVVRGVEDSHSEP